MRTLWNDDWDWRPLARLVVWGMVAAAFMPPLDYRAIAREIVLGWLLTFGILTRIQLALAAVALRLMMAADRWTYAAAAKLARSVGTDYFAAALVAQLLLILGPVAAVMRL